VEHRNLNSINHFVSKGSVPDQVEDENRGELDIKTEEDDY